MRNLLKRLICLVRGHDFRASVFHANVLTFCQRCGAELCGRSFDDLEPMTAEELEQSGLLDDWT